MEHLGEKFDRALWRNVEMEKDDSKSASQSYA